MSKIYDQLKQAEAERERVVAERKRLEAEADAALAAQEREERMRRAGAAPAPRVAVDEGAERAIAEARARLEAGRRAVEREEAERAAEEEEKAPLVAARPGVPGAAWFASLAAALAAGLTIGLLVPRKASPPPARADSGVIAPAVLPLVPEGSLALRLDRDVESFGERAARKQAR